MLIAGAAIARVWVKTGPHSYDDFVDFVILDEFLIGDPYVDENGLTHLTLTLQYLINAVLMALVLGSDTSDAVACGWAIATATDIALSYLVGRVISGGGHPAVRFLLLLVIADDAAGMGILTVLYPSVALSPLWLVLSFSAALGVYVMFNALPLWRDQGNQLRMRSIWMRQKRPISVKNSDHDILCFRPFFRRAR